MRKTVEEIVLETVKFYCDDPTRRSFNLTSIGGPGHCLYSSGADDDKKECAVGRCMTSNALRSLEGTIVGVGDLVRRADVESLDNLLKEEYRGHELDLWRALQHFHDSHEAFQNKKEMMSKLVKLSRETHVSLDKLKIAAGNMV